MTKDRNSFRAPSARRVARRARWRGGENARALAHPNLNTPRATPPPGVTDLGDGYYRVQPNTPGAPVPEETYRALEDLRTERREQAASANRPRGAFSGRGFTDLSDDA